MRPKKRKRKDKRAHESAIPHIAVLTQLVESGMMELDSAIEIAIDQIGRDAPMCDYFAEISGELGRQLRIITYLAINEPERPDMQCWLNPGSLEIENGIKKLVKSAHKYGLQTDDLFES